MIYVYVKTKDTFVTDIKSSIFLIDNTGYEVIDRGYGDKYVHAQSQYLDKPLVDDFGRYNYRMSNGKIIEIPEDEKPVIEEVDHITLEDRVEAMENALLEMVLGGI